MLISELIKELERLKDEHGDLPVMSNDCVGEYTPCICDNYIDENGNPFVLV